MEKVGHIYCWKGTTSRGGRSHNFLARLWLRSLLLYGLRGLSTDLCPRFYWCLPRIWSWRSVWGESISAGRLLLISSSREMDTLLVRCCSVSLGSEVLELTSTPNSLATVCLKPSRWLSLHSIEVCWRHGLVISSRELNPLIWITLK